MRGRSGSPFLLRFPVSPGIQTAPLMTPRFDAWMPVSSRLSSRTHPWRCPLPLLIAGYWFSVVGLALPPRSVNQLYSLRITGPYNMHATEQAPE